MAYGSALMFQSLGQNLGNLGSEISRMALIDQQQKRQDRRDEVADMRAASMLGLEEDRLAEVIRHNAETTARQKAETAARRVERADDRTFQAEQGRITREWQAGQSALGRAQSASQFDATQAAGREAMAQRLNIGLAGLNTENRRLDMARDRYVDPMAQFESEEDYTRAAILRAQNSGMPVDPNRIGTEWDTLSPLLNPTPQAPPGGAGISGVPNVVEEPPRRRQQFVTPGSPMAGFGEAIGEALRAPPMGMEDLMRGPRGY